MNHLLEPPALIHVDVLTRAAEETATEERRFDTFIFSTLLVLLMNSLRIFFYVPYFLFFPSLLEESCNRKWARKTKPASEPTLLCLHSVRFFLELCKWVCVSERGRMLSVRSHVTEPFRGGGMIIQRDISISELVIVAFPLMWLNFQHEVDWVSVQEGILVFLYRVVDKYVKPCLHKPFSGGSLWRWKKKLR